MKTIFLTVIFAGGWLLFAPSVPAGSRTSAGYSVTTDVNDAGGRKTSGTSYTNDASIGSIGGNATVASPAETGKGGYAGQLYEITGLSLAASLTNIPAGSNSQLSAVALLDDNSLVLLAATQVVWSVVSGPVASINSNGLATAGSVSQNTAATVGGASLGASGTLQLTVLVVGSQSSPRITGISAGAGGTLQINGTGGIATSNYFILASTNLSLPLAGWTVLKTNQFDNSGNFNSSVSVNTNQPASFYILKMP